MMYTQYRVGFRVPLPLFVIEKFDWLFRYSIKYDRSRPLLSRNCPNPDRKFLDPQLQYIKVTIRSIMLTYTFTWEPNGIAQVNPSTCCNQFHVKIDAFHNMPKELTRQASRISLVFHFLLFQISIMCHSDLANDDLIQAKNEGELVL